MENMFASADEHKNIQTHVQHENRASSVIPLAFSCIESLFSD
jgi:hypothetical protein